jgi:LmbE family N-acetylglucosaminyl deacetylase
MVPVIEGSEPDAVSDQVAQPPDDRTWTPASPGSRLDPTKYLRPIVLTPHPDDLEGFAGGLAFKLTSGAISVIFAGGDRGVWAPEYARMPKREYIHVRLEESAEAARLLGAKEVIYLGYLDRAVECNEESIQKVLDLLRRYQPDLVASFEFYRWANPYPHPDHLAVGNIVRHAIARYEHNDRLDYLLTSTLLPNAVVDVTGVRRVKLEALACHTTQIGLNGVIFPFLERFITRLWGAFNGVDFAEGYRLVDVARMMQRLGAKRGRPPATD